MATQTVTDDRIPTDYDPNAAHECILKARGVIEMMGPYAISMFGYESAQATCNSAWVVADQLDKLEAMMGLTPEPQPEAQA